MKTTLALAAIMLAAIYLLRSPAQAQRVGTVSNSGHSVVAISGYPYYPDNWDWNGPFTLIVNQYTASTNGYQVHTGDNWAQDIAAMLDQGYNFVGEPKWDEYGWGIHAVLVK